MAYQSTWYYTDLPEKVVDLIEQDLTENFDPQMADSKLHGDALNKEKRNSQNAWIPTNHWVGGFIWHFISQIKPAKHLMWKRLRYPKLLEVNPTQHS